MTTSGRMRRQAKALQGQRSAGKNADATGDVTIALLGQPITGAGRGRQDDFGFALRMELPEEGTDGLDFPDRHGLDPKAASAGGFFTDFRKKTESLAETGSVASAPKHSPKIVGEGWDEQQGEEDPVGPSHRDGLNLRRRARPVSSK